VLRVSRFGQGEPPDETNRTAPMRDTIKPSPSPRMTALSACGPQPKDADASFRVPKIVVMNGSYYHDPLVLRCAA